MGSFKDEMAFRMRSSKFRHVFGSPAKKEFCYEGIKITKNAHDSHFCAVNPKFVAVVTECAGGGTFNVIPIEKTGRLDINAARVCGHTGQVLDIKWNPFNDNVIASCSEDATVKLWHIPDGGLRGNLVDWMVDLHGHTRRVGFLEWHPVAENILLSAGYDFKCILWNSETAEPINIIDVHVDTIFSISWNRDGSLFATTSKDKKIRVIDPRDGKVVSTGSGHQGTKSSKSVYVSENRIFTTGFSRNSERQYAIWDSNDLSKPLRLETVDSSSGILFPFYDHDTQVVFIVGKGDGNIRFYELVKEAPFVHYLNQYQSPNPQRSCGIMPKRGVDTKKCEIVRFYKLHTLKNMVEPVSMVVPRKSEMFQADIFVPTASICPSLSADEWISGQNREPILVSLKDGSISGNRTITTYKAVRRQASTNDTAPSKATTNGSTSKVTEQRLLRRQATAPASTEGEENQENTLDLPASVRNIQRLSANEDDIENHLSPENATESVHDMVNSFEKKSTERSSPSPLRASRKLWTSEYTSTELTNGTTSTDSDKVHVKKVWSPDVHYDGLQNSAAGDHPTTDPELRKAYFNQVEEIRSLKEQIRLKDKRIRQLEEEVSNLREDRDLLAESNC